MNVLLITNYSTQVLQKKMSSEFNFTITDFQNHLTQIMNNEFDNKLKITLAKRSGSKWAQKVSSLQFIFRKSPLF